MGTLTLLVGFIVVFGERAAEQLFGAFVKGWPMQFLSLGCAVGVAIGTKFLAREVPLLPEFGWAATVVIGVFSGLFGTAWHTWLTANLPGVNKVTLGQGVKLLGKLASTPAHGNLPPQPPAR
jgi:quinol-cytochrome oxidoreductase complex cytochrome b subunit